MIKRVENVELHADKKMCPYIPADVSVLLLDNLIMSLYCVLQVAVFYPNKGEYEIQLQSRSRTESPQITSGKRLNCKTSLS